MIGGGSRKSSNAVGDRERNILYVARRGNAMRKPAESVPSPSSSFPEGADRESQANTTGSEGAPIGGAVNPTDTDQATSRAKAAAPLPGDASALDEANLN